MTSALNNPPLSRCHSLEDPLKIPTTPPPPLPPHPLLLISDEAAECTPVSVPRDAAAAFHLPHPTRRQLKATAKRPK
ncbi:unnamed protein product, partial [Iphiclides podalirius]